MKKNSYLRPSMTVEKMDATDLICASQDITSNVGLNYGGVDEEGTKPVDSRQYSVWDDDDEI